MRDKDATYAYDRNGNLISKTSATGTTRYGYDFENRLVSVVNPDATRVEFKYDVFGRRIEKKTTPSPLAGEGGGEGVTRYFYDGEDILVEYDGSGNVGNRYTHGPGIDEPLALTTDKGVYFYHADGLGSIVALTDKDQTVVQDYQYGFFGDLKDLKNRIKQPYTYTAREYDRETGLYFYRARYYDAEAGRFITKDPIGFRGGMNMYAYVSGNPVNYTDPWGLMSGEERAVEFFSGLGTAALGAATLVGSGIFTVGTAGLATPVSLPAAGLGVAALTWGVVQMVEAIEGPKHQVVPNEGPLYTFIYACTESETAAATGELLTLIPTTPVSKIEAAGILFETTVIIGGYILDESDIEQGIWYTY